MKKLWLYAGVVGPLLFIAVFLVEGATRPGYSAWRMYVSQLATGPGGWVQVVNFFEDAAAAREFGVKVQVESRPLDTPPTHRCGVHKVHQGPRRLLPTPVAGTLPVDKSRH